MMNALSILLMVTLCALLALTVSAKDSDLSFKRVHLVDYVDGNGFQNYFFRSNLPVLNETFAYDTLLEYMKIRAQDAQIPFPTNPYLVDISLMNDFDQSKAEKAFWDNPANAQKGEFIYWPMGLAGLYDPRSYQGPEQVAMANGTVWEFDLLPQRAEQLYQMMRTPSTMLDPITHKPRPIIFVAHCQAGCDRTGQMIISYRIRATKMGDFTLNTLKEYFALNVDECTRCPNDWSVKATEWYCLYYKFNYAVNMGDCLDIAECKRFGSCEPIPL